MWIAIATIDYEGGTVIGVYSTKLKAENAVKRWNGYCDNTFIRNIKLDKEEDINV